MKNNECCQTGEAVMFLEKPEEASSVRTLDGLRLGSNCGLMRRLYLHKLQIGDTC